MTVTIPKVRLPGGSRVTLKLEVSTDFNVSAAVAGQRVNRFLAMNVGNMLAAGEPELVVGEELLWRVPVLFGTPKKGLLGKVGELFVDVNSGEILIESPQQLEEMMRRAEILYPDPA